MASSSDWGSGGLPSHLLGLILSRLPIADYIRSGAVSTSWRQVTGDYLHHRIPYLMLPGGGDDDDNEESGNFFSLSGEKVYHLPHIHGKRCLGSSAGWLVTMDNLAELHLLNPFTGVESSLPSITTLCFIQGVQRDPDSNNIIGYQVKDADADADYPPDFLDLEHIRNYYFFKVVFFPSASIAVAIHGVLRELAFARVGDNSWTKLRSPDSFFEDFILHKGQLYGITCSGSVLVFEFGDGDGGSPSSSQEIIFGDPKSNYHDHYLVESPDGHLLQVWRGWTSAPWDPDHDEGPSSYLDEYVRRTTVFRVFRLDPSGLQWVEVRNLGETALFLGHNHSMSLSTKDLPELRRNCIYFTEDNCEQYVVTPHARRDMGVYNLEDGSVESLFPLESPLNRLNWPPPIWMVPALS